MTAAGLWLYQVKYGMGAANIHQPVDWGVYIANFVFWVGLAHSGTLISAILFLVRAKFRGGILTTYFTFIQLLTIWYENMPDETQYLVQRMNYPGWNVISSLIVGLFYLGPLVFLLTIRAKRNRVFLGAISLLLLAGLWFERWWMVSPTFFREPVIGWVEAAAAGAILGITGLSIILVRKYLPALPLEKEKAQ